MRFRSRLLIIALLMALVLAACAQAITISPDVSVLDLGRNLSGSSSGFAAVDGSRQLTFPADFGAHPDFRTEWWYYTGNLQTKEGRHFGFELTIFRVGLLPPSAELPADSDWSTREVYLAHFALSDVQAADFYAFERYSRDSLGLAGAESVPYHVWLEDWSITEPLSGQYELQARQGDIALHLALRDELGVVLHGENGYSRKGKNPTHASYYYSQPRLRADGTIDVDGVQYSVSGLAWKDHEFSTSLLDENQIGWDWFSLQFEDGRALMLFQLREQGGAISASSSGTFIDVMGTPMELHKSDLDIQVLENWRSPHTQGSYPAAWQIRLQSPGCVLDVQPWTQDQEIHFPAVTYWEGAVHFEGICDGVPVGGNGYVELTGYAGKLPLQ